MIDLNPSLTREDLFTPSMDMQTLNIEYSFSVMVILGVHLYMAYLMVYKVFWKVLFQTNIEQLPYDIYDKINILFANEYLLLNMLNLVMLSQINSPVAALMRLALLLSIFIIFLKFFFKKFLIRYLTVVSFILLYSNFEVTNFGQLPLGTITMCLITFISLIGLNQISEVTKILKSHLFQDKELSNHQRNNFSGHQIGYQTLVHLKNRRAYCVTMAGSLLVSSLCIWQIQAFQKLIGQILVSLVIDIGPIYAIYYNFKRSDKANQEAQQLRTFQSDVSRNSNASSHIYIEMEEMHNRL